MGAPGCDDAPLVTVPRGGAWKTVTMIYPYYDNPDFLRRQLDGWLALPRLMRASLRVIVVDDGSPRSPAEVVLRERPFSFLRLFRIEVDVRWNWLAARNVGAHYAQDGWLMMTDMDHVAPPDTLLGLITGQHDPSVIYRFSRVGSKTHPHPNSWFFTRDMFWRIGGYDEACSGFYGTDGDYRRRCAATARIKIMTEPLELHEYVGDSSTTTYKRKQPEDTAVKRMIRARSSAWKPRTLSFPHHEVRL